MGFIIIALLELSINFNEATHILHIYKDVMLFVIPGLIFWVQLTFVPYVVMFDPEFKSGTVDALERSKLLVKGHFWRITGILILCLLLSMVPEFWLGAIKPLDNPLLFAFLFLVGMVLDLYGDVVVFCVYENLVQKT